MFIDFMGMGPGDPPWKQFAQGVAAGFTGYYTNIGDAVSFAVNDPGGAALAVWDGASDTENLINNYADVATFGAHSAALEVAEVGQDLADGNYEAAGEAVGNKGAQVGTAYATAGIIKGAGKGIQALKNVKIKGGNSNVHGNSVNSSKPSGNYEHTFKSNKTYNGVGPESRMKASGKKLSTKYNDPVVKSTYKPAPNRRTSYIREHRGIQRNGGAGNTARNYNIRNSPGKKLLEEGK